MTTDGCFRMYRVIANDPLDKIYVKKRDKILFGISCEIELEERKYGLRWMKNRVFHRNIVCYAHNYMSYERNYIC